MADLAQFIDTSVAQTNRAIRSVRKSYYLPATGINSGDNVQLHVIPTGSVLTLNYAKVTSLAAAGLGGSATITLQINRGGVRTPISIPSTAGSTIAIDTRSFPAVPFNLLGGDIIELNVGGGAVTSAATVELDLHVSQR